MKVKIIIMLLAAILLVRPGYGQEIELKTPADYVKTADIYYETKSFTENSRKEIMDIMIKAADMWPNDYQIQWRAARAIYVYGDAFHYQYMLENYDEAISKKQVKTSADVIETSQDMNAIQSKKLLALGILARKYAERAVVLNPQGVEGHNYNALGISLYAFGKSIVKALMEGLAPKYEKQLDEAIAIDRGYGSGGLYSAYGRYWYTLPWPKRNLKKSLEYLITATKYSPTNMQMLDFLGDTYYVLGKKEDARIMWEQVLKSSDKGYISPCIFKLAQAKLNYLK